LALADLGEASQRINKYWSVNTSPFDTILGNQVNGLWGYLKGRGNVAATVGAIAFPNVSSNLSQEKNVLEHSSLHLKLIHQKFPFP
jgi:hypothetical protein